MNPTAKKYADLVEKLYAQTVAKQLVWIETGADTVLASVGSITVGLSKFRNVSNEPFEKVSIYKDGAVIDSFTDSKFETSSPPVEGFATYYTFMNSLRVLAIRQARGADDALDQLLKDLG